MYFLPMDAAQVRKIWLNGKGALLTYGKHVQAHVVINGWEQIGTGFWLVCCSVGDEHLQFLLQPDGRNTEDGRFPFWEVDD